MVRYRLARAMGKDRYREVLREDAELLARYGLKLMSVDCGIRAAVLDEIKQDEKGRDQIHPWNVIEVDAKTWKWLHPLLVRLRDAEAALEAQSAQAMAAK